MGHDPTIAIETCLIPVFFADDLRAERDFYRTAWRVGRTTDQGEMVRLVWYSDDLTPSAKETLETDLRGHGWTYNPKTKVWDRSV